MTNSTLATAATLDSVVAAAAAAADDVDARARFPHEAIDEAKRAKLLSCAFPTEFGGQGTPIREVARMTRRIGEACPSTGMIFAMHQSQAGIIGRHAVGTSSHLIREIVESEALIASATTEITTGGDIRRSTCAIVEENGRVLLEKNAPVVSYGDDADYICITARRSPDAPATDQVLVLARRDQVDMEPTRPWNVMGFRGTCSPGFILRANIPPENVMPHDYGTISERTVLPTAHILWSSVWLGMADAALEKARNEVRAAARKAPDTVTPAAVKFTDLLVVHQEFEAFLFDAIARYEAFLASGEEEPSVGFTIAMNNLKLKASTAVVDVVTGALSVCGLNGYRDDHPASMNRLLRDAFGPALMVSNDRIRANNAEIVLAYRRTAR